MNKLLIPKVKKDLFEKLLYFYELILVAQIIGLLISFSLGIFPGWYLVVFIILYPLTLVFALKKVLRRYIFFIILLHIPFIILLNVTSEIRITLIFVLPGIFFYLYLSYFLYMNTRGT